MKPLFRDQSAQEQFDRDGFFVSRLFAPEQVERLLALYRSHVQESEVSGLYESSRNKPYDVNRSINEAIRDQVTLAAADLLLPSKLYGGTFMVKSHVRSDVLPLHQDWSVVEEDRYRTMFVWCPLVDLSVLNGGLFVLPGSHRYFAATLRSGSYASNRYVLPAQLSKHVQDVPLRAGQAIFYSDALFHGSHANDSTQDRIVVTARVMEDGADLVYFHRASDTEVDVHLATPELYLTHIDGLAKGLMPAGIQKLYRRSYTHVPVTDDALQAQIRRHFAGQADPLPMQHLFREPAVQHEFERKGFVVIDLIDPSQVAELQAFYLTLQNAETPPGGFQVSLDNERPEFVRAVSARLMDTAGPSVETHLKDFQIFTASFVTKQKDPLGVVPPHQDWTFVDEARFWSATIWCPLVDVTADNGALGLIRGSHRFYDHVRPSPSPQYSPPFTDQLSSIFPYLAIVELRAGQAIVFNNQTLHASPPNTTGQTRIAFGLGVTHRDAALRHYYLLPGQTAPLVEGYEVGREFFFNYNNARLSAMFERGEKPQGLNSIGTFAVRSTHYDTDQLIRVMKAAGNSEDPAVPARMAALYPPNKAKAAVGGAGAGDRDASQRRIDPRPFWKVYTPANIAREISYRLRKS